MNLIKWDNKIASSLLSWAYWFIFLFTFKADFTPSSMFKEFEKGYQGLVRSGSSSYGHRKAILMAKSKAPAKQKRRKRYFNIDRQGGVLWQIKWDDQLIFSAAAMMFSTIETNYVLWAVLSEADQTSGISDWEAERDELLTSCQRWLAR